MVKKVFELFPKSQQDIALTDFDMPGRDGIILALHNKETSPNTLVILMTVHDRESFMGQIKDGLGIKIIRAVYV